MVYNNLLNMGMVYPYINFFVFGCDAWEKALNQPCSITEKKLSEEGKYIIRQYGAKPKLFFCPKENKYEIDDVIILTHEAAFQSIQECSRMQSAAKSLLKTTFAVSIVSLLWLKSNFSYAKLALTITSVGMSVLAFFRHRKARVFENKASRHISYLAKEIHKQRTNYFEFQKIQTSGILLPNSKILHHIEVEQIVIGEILLWCDQLTLSHQTSPQNKQAYVELFLDGPFLKKSLRDVLNNYSVNPSPLLEWYEQSVDYIQKNDNTVKKYKQDLIDQRNWITGEIPYDSNEIRGQLDDQTYNHFWDLALQGAADNSEEIKPIWDHQKHQLELLNERYAIYYDAVKILIDELKAYLFETSSPLSNPVQILEQSFTEKSWPGKMNWQSDQFLKGNWVPKAKALTPTLGSRVEYENFLLRTSTELFKLQYLFYRQEEKEKKIFKIEY